jgi:hypothetical protein
LSQYSIGEALFLLWALCLDFLYQRIPRNVFYRKNTFDNLLQQKADIRKDKGESVIIHDNMIFRLRRKGSDFMVFNQIVLGSGMSRVIELARTLDSKPLRIMDCGANIGLATMMFRKAFPDDEAH